MVIYSSIHIYPDSRIEPRWETDESGNRYMVLVFRRQDEGPGDATLFIDEAAVDKLRAAVATTPAVEIQG